MQIDLASGHRDGKATRASIVKAGARGLACAAALAGLTALTPDGSAAVESTIPCGSHYTVVRGDTLFSIAALAYGDGEHFRVLFDVNQDILSSIDSIDVGNRLLVPCLEGTEVGSKPLFVPVARSTVLQAPEESLGEPISTGTSESPALGVDTGIAADIAAAAEPVNAAVAEPAAKASPDPVASVRGFTAPEPALSDTQAYAASVTLSTDREVVFLAGSLLPYAGESLPGGGMLTELIAQALQAAASEWPYRIGFAGAWSPYLPGPAAGESFDIGFPAIRPDCGPDSFMSERTQQACDSYVYSRPILMAEIAYYASRGDPIVAGTSAAALAGHRFCSAEQPLEAAWSPTSPNALYGPEEPAPALERCLVLLASGQTDVVMGLKSDGDAMIARLGLGGTVSEIDGLRNTQTLHAFAPKGDAYAREVLRALDRGIGDLMISGRWFEIVSRHETDRFAILTK